MIRPRNFAARSPLLRKGGVHKESKSTVRNESRHNLASQLLEWENERETANEYSAEDAAHENKHHE